MRNGSHAYTLSTNFLGQLNLLLPLYLNEICMRCWVCQIDAYMMQLKCNYWRLLGVDIFLEEKNEYTVVTTCYRGLIVSARKNKTLWTFIQLISGTERCNIWFHQYWLHWSYRWEIEMKFLFSLPWSKKLKSFVCSKFVFLFFSLNLSLFSHLVKSQQTSMQTQKQLWEY